MKNGFCIHSGPFPSKLGAGLSVPSPQKKCESHPSSGFKHHLDCSNVPRIFSSGLSTPIPKAGAEFHGPEAPCVRGRSGKPADQPVLPVSGSSLQFNPAGRGFAAQHPTAFRSLAKKCRHAPLKRSFFSTPTFRLQYPDFQT